MSTGKYRKESDCLNCGHHVEEHFCTHCGQENIEIKEDALHMITHAIADYFHFESKFFGTIKPLLVQPGCLSKLYVAGKRVSFIHPIRLYIFISIVFFLVILSSDKSAGDHEAEPAKKEAKSDDKSAASVLKIESLEKELKNPSLTEKEKDSLIKVAVSELKNQKSNSFDFNLNSKWLNKSDSTLAAYEQRQKTLPAKQRDNFVKHYVLRKTFDIRKYPDPKEKIKEEIMHNIPKMMFILLPLFALILKLVYLKCKKYYYEHLIYSFHVHAAVFLSFLILNLLQWFFHLFYDISNLLSFVWSIYIIWYIYRSLRTFYGSKRWVAVAKILFLMFCYLLVFSLSTLIVIAGSMIML
jgi:hypothetical protein